MTEIRTALIAGVAFTLFGCQTLATAGDVPARITDPTDASRAALRDAVNEALGIQVTLAEDALTTSSILTLEHNPPGSINSMPAQGRTLDAPIQFRLMMNGSDCILVNQRDGRRHTLADTTCSPE